MRRSGYLDSARTTAQAASAHSSGHNERVIESMTDGASTETKAQKTVLKNVLLLIR